MRSFGRTGIDTMTLVQSVALAVVALALGVSAGGGSSKLQVHVRFYRTRYRVVSNCVEGHPSVEVV